MALSYRSRKRLALLILVIGMPLYVVVAVNVVDWANARFGRLPILAELAVFIGLGLMWALPFRRIFRGIGQPDPDQPQDKNE
ncbi:DUF2842 domain-containing protein [Neotabrizicola sp. VNH66]|uniref:DUF2842 domain-containing protein n=1 Tax=Neotabrizicola sp. VNH66 TaxID=3400918 RepID=UPI003C079156